VADLPRSHLAVYLLAAAVIAFVGLRALRDRAPSGPVPGAARPAAGAGGLTGADRARVTVHVVGAVRRPGVYRLRNGQRVTDAVRRAGGVARRADLSGVNLAARLEDGRQVLVPRRARAGEAGPAGAGPSSPAPPVNLNTATPAELDTLDGVGPAMAAKIIEHRREHGGFGSVDELDEIPGIGPKRLETLRELVRF